MVTPVLAQTPYNTLIFTIMEQFKLDLAKRYPQMDEKTKSLFAGCYAATFGALIYSPVELLKVRAQVNRQEFIRYRECVPQIIRQEGFFRGLYRGFVPLLCRDLPSWGAYFWAYDFFKDLLRVEDKTLYAEHPAL